MLTALASNQLLELLLTGALPGGLPVSETWTVADAPNSLTGDHGWTPYLGTNQWGIVSGAAQLENSGGLTQAGRMNWDMESSDYQVTATIAEFAHPGTGVLVGGLAARMQGDASFTFYALVGLANGGTKYLVLYSFVGGVQTTLGIETMTATAPFTLTLRLVGSSLKAYLDGVLAFDVTDTAIPTGRFVGVEGYSNSAGNRVRVTSLNGQAPPLTVRRGHFYSMTPLTGVR